MKKLLLLICFMWCSSSFAFIYQARALINPATNQRFFLLSDFHDHNSAGKQQRDDLLKALSCLSDQLLLVEDPIGMVSNATDLIAGCQEAVKQFNETKAQILETNALIEQLKKEGADVSHYPVQEVPDEKQIRCSLDQLKWMPYIEAIAKDYQNQQNGNWAFNYNNDYSQLLPKGAEALLNDAVPLDYLCQFCHRRSIPVCNIECRISKGTGYVSPEIFRKHYTELCNHAELLVGRFGQNSKFVELYGQPIERLSRELHNLDFSVPEWCPHCAEAWYKLKQDSFLALFHDDMFIETNIFHQLLNSSAQNIVLYAGGLHVGAVYQVLVSDFGYKPIGNFAGFMSWDLKKLQPINVGDFFQQFVPSTMSRWASMGLAALAAFGANYGATS